MNREAAAKESKASSRGKRTSIVQPAGWTDGHEPGHELGCLPIGSIVTAA